MGTERSACWGRWLVDFLEIGYATMKGYPIRRTWRYIEYLRACQWADACFAHDDD